MKELYSIDKTGLTVDVSKSELSLPFQTVFIPTWLLLILSVSIVIAAMSKGEDTTVIEEARVEIKTPVTIKTEYTEDDYRNAPIILIEDEGEDEDKLTFGEHNKQTAQEYIDLYLELAKQQEKKHNIPVAITLAQGLHESNAGNSRLARNHNNHFGIKCFNRICKKDHCVNYHDDHHKDFFISFKSVWACYNYRSQFLHKDRYKHLMKLKKTDYKGWANGLQKAGYATDQKYAKNLIRTIEKYGLHKL